MNAQKVILKNSVSLVEQSRTLFSHPINPFFRNRLIMILNNTPTNKAVLSNVAQVNSFAIKATANSFQILSSVQDVFNEEYYSQEQYDDYWPPTV